MYLSNELYYTIEGEEFIFYVLEEKEEKNVKLFTEKGMYRIKINNVAGKEEIYSIEIN